MSDSNVRYAGPGADGNDYAVVGITGPASYRRKPCETCPWRRDSQVGRFPAQAYRESAHTAYDAVIAAALLAAVILGAHACGVRVRIELEEVW